MDISAHSLTPGDYVIAFGVCQGLVGCDTP